MNALDLRRSRILSEPRLLAEALDLGLEPRDRKLQTNGGVTVRCPRHNGVSLSISRGPDGTARVHCFGAAGCIDGDALTLIGAALGTDDFGEITRYAAELAGRQDLRAQEIAGAPNTSAPGVSDETYAAIATELLERCPLVNALEAAKYLRVRMIFADAEAAGVRALPKDQGALINELRALFREEDLVGAGVLHPTKRELDWSAWSLLIPWRDRHGRIDCIQRRVLAPREPKYRFPKGRKPRAPFGVDLLRVVLEDDASAEVVITEGALDCLARRRIARDRDERAAVIAVQSASAPCEGLPLDLLTRRRVVLALDADEAGERACAKLVEVLRGVASELVRETPAAGDDWNAALMRGAP